MQGTGIVHQYTSLHIIGGLHIGGRAPQDILHLLRGGSGVPRSPRDRQVAGAGGGVLGPVHQHLDQVPLLGLQPVALLPQLVVEPLELVSAAQEAVQLLLFLLSVK